MRREFAFCLLAGMLNILLVSKGAASSAEELIKGLAMRERNITTLTGEFRLKAEYLKNGVLEKWEKLYKWIKKGKMQKMSSEYLSFPESFKEVKPSEECKGCSVITETGEEIRFFDGEVTKTYFARTKQASIQPGDYVSIRKTPADWLLLRFGGKPLSVFLKQENMNVTYTGKKKLGTEICHLLEFSKDEKMRGKLYLSDNKGLVPTRFEIEIKNTSAAFNTKGVHTFKKFRNYGGIWFPRRMDCVIYNVYPHRKEVAAKEILDVKGLQVNIEVPQKDIILKFPSGTLVSDSILHLRYRVP